MRWHDVGATKARPAGQWKIIDAEGVVREPCIGVVEDGSSHLRSHLNRRD